MDARLAHPIRPRRYLRAGLSISRVLGLLLGLGVMIQACSDNNGRAAPTYPAGQTGRTALAIFPNKVSLSDTSDAGTCHEQVQFLVTGGEPPYRLTTAFSAGAPFGHSSVDSSGLYKAIVESGASFNPDTVLVIDAIGAQVSASVTILCDVAAATSPTPTP